jgi:hypothetical protein
MKRLLALLLFCLALACCMDAMGQNVTRQGNTFVQVDTRQESKPATKTQYVYTDKKGNSYPIYLSAKGKAFIIKVSKKTGKEYRQYIPSKQKRS